MNPTALLDVLAGLSAVLACIGIGVVAAGAVAVRRFAAQAPHPASHRPAITVLKPLCGYEPLLEEALASVCTQDYPVFQVVFGVQDPADPALKVVHRLRKRFPHVDIHVVVDPTLHGSNRKISNLINMMPYARYDALVSSDSDLHVAPDYLERIAAALDMPGTGLVTTVCLGAATAPGLAARLGATGISHCFTPGALLSRLLGREDCLGTTMALRRHTLLRVGGWHGLADHLADDNVLSQRVRELGLRTALARTVPRTGVPDASLRRLWQHELRWARTIRALTPLLFFTSALQYPLFWAMLACLLTAGAGWAVGLFAAAWVIRTAAARSTDAALRGSAGPEPGAPHWLLPLRDALSIGELAASYMGGGVVWRGHAMHVNHRRPEPAGPAATVAALKAAAPAPVEF